jgi:hypothetical protein
VASRAGACPLSDTLKATPRHELRAATRRRLRTTGKIRHIGMWMRAGESMNTATHRNHELLARLGLDEPTPLAIRREAARELCAEIIRNLDNTSRAHEFSERAAFILYGDASEAVATSPRRTARRLCDFIAA